MKCHSGKDSFGKYPCSFRTNCTNLAFIVLFLTFTMIILFYKHESIIQMSTIAGGVIIFLITMLSVTHKH